MVAPWFPANPDGHVPCSTLSCRTTTLKGGPAILYTIRSAMYGCPVLLCFLMFWNCLVCIAILAFFVLVCLVAYRKTIQKMTETTKTNNIPENLPFSVV